MTIYLLNLVIVTLSSKLSDMVKEKNKKALDIFLLIAMMSLSLVAGFRYKVGTDYFTYSEIYMYEGGDPIIFKVSEGGFDILIKLLYKITENPQFFFFVTSIIINACIVIFIKKYSIDFTFSMYLYIVTFSYYATMNGLRQYIASAILIFGYKHVMLGNFKKYLLFVVGAYTFHSSALIMIPLYFVVRGKTYSRINLFVVSLFTVAFVFYQPFVNILFNIMGDSKYGYYGEVMADTSNGANVFRIIVWMLPVILVLLYRKRALRVHGKEVEIILNYCILGTLFMFLAYRHVFYARFCMYFDVYYLLLLPRICSLFDERTNKVFRIAITVGYFAYSTMLLLSGEAWIYPYKYNLNIF